VLKTATFRGQFFNFLNFLVLLLRSIGLDRTVNSKRVSRLIDQYRKSLRNKISSTSDVQTGLIHTRNHLIVLSSRYDRNVLYLLCYQFLSVLFQKLNFKPAIETSELFSVPERLESPSGPDEISITPSFVGYFVGQLMAEIELAPFERTESAHSGLETFVSIPHSIIQDWLAITTKERLPWRIALVYLAARIAINRHKGATEKQICGYIGLNQKTVKRHLNKLKNIHFIQLRHAIVDGEKSIYLYYLPEYSDRLVPIPSFNIILETSRPWFAELNPFNGRRELDWSPFAPWKPINVESPLIQVQYDTIDCHERSLEASIVLAACFSLSQISEWLNSTQRSYSTQLIPAIEEIFQTQIKTRFSIPERKHLHYRQISIALPILMYAARREFQIDIPKMVTMAKRTHTDLKLVWHNFLVNWEGLRLEAGFCGALKKLDWDARYFLTCFLRVDPYHHWEKRYPDKFPNIPLGHSLMGSNSKWVTLSKDMFNVDSLAALAERSGLANDLLKVIRLFRDRNLLRRLRKTTYAVNTTTPRGITKTLDNASHRIYVVAAPRQSISKRLRSIFLARPGHQFLMFDVKQNDLQLWQALRPQFSREVAEDNKPLEFEDISQAAGISRDSVKHIVYFYFYGARRMRIMTEFGLTHKHWLILKRLVFDRFTSMRRDIIKHTKDNGFTPPTPLNYRIPVNRKHYRAPSLYVQAVGAEIFRQWILQLHDKDLTQYIVNLIHDEIVMQVPCSMNLYDLAKDVQTSLDQAVVKLLPRANLKLRAKAARRWDSDASVIIRS